MVTEIVEQETQVEKGMDVILGGMWINLSYHQQEVNRLKNLIKSNEELKVKQSRIVDYYGANYQLKRLTEECGELIVAIAKFQRSGQSLNVRGKIPTNELMNVISEMADILNLVEQIKNDYRQVREGIDKVKEYKVNRELDRIGEKNEGL